MMTTTPWSLRVYFQVVKRNEYTIKKVNDVDGVVSIILRTPDTPRFTGTTIPDQVIAGRGQKSAKYAKPKSDNDSFEVSQQEFEKEYEVD